MSKANGAADAQRRFGNRDEHFGTDKAKPIPARKKSGDDDVFRMTREDALAEARRRFGDRANSMKRSSNETKS